MRSPKSPASRAGYARSSEDLTFSRQSASIFLPGGCPCSAERPRRTGKQGTTPAVIVGELLQCHRSGCPAIPHGVPPGRRPGGDRGRVTAIRHAGRLRLSDRPGRWLRLRGLRCPPRGGTAGRHPSTCPSHARVPRSAPIPRLRTWYPVRSPGWRRSEGDPPETATDPAARHQGCGRRRGPLLASLLDRSGTDRGRCNLCALPPAGQRSEELRQSCTAPRARPNQGPPPRQPAAGPTAKRRRRSPPRWPRPRRRGFAPGAIGRAQPTNPRLPVPRRASTA